MTLSGRTYVCSAGETFDSVALAVYGDEAFASELMSANPKYSTEPVFTGGEVLELPVVEVQEADDGEGTYAPAPAPWKE